MGSGAGADEGAGTGKTVGAKEGLGDGFKVGCCVGEGSGILDGAGEGLIVGRAVGKLDGAPDRVGLGVGSGLGLYDADGIGVSGVGLGVGGRVKADAPMLLVSTVAPTLDATAVTKLAEVNVVVSELENSAGVETPNTVESDTDTTKETVHVKVARRRSV